MDLLESLKIVYYRIQKLEPEDVLKIIGCILVQKHDEREMIWLAFCPDNFIHTLIDNAKSELGELGLCKPAVSAPASASQVMIAPGTDMPLQFTPQPSRSIIAPPSHHPANGLRNSQVPADLQEFANSDVSSQGYPKYVSGSYPLHNHMQFLNLEDQLDFVDPYCQNFSNNCFYSELATGFRTSRRSASLPEFPIKVCQFFIRGFCKYGNNCRYFHGYPTHGRIPQVFSRSSNESVSEDQYYSPQSLEKLEVDLTELLKSNKSMPVSIAALPMLYYQKFGRALQAEGYLTESQRHGKAGYSLTKLLACMRNICLIDKPNGQHSVVLAEDLPEYQNHAVERRDVGVIIAGSRQIYLTFPAESKFTEQDVANYFAKFGPVQDVRIPCEDKRMFGFVTFVNAETARQVLLKGNPHYVSGARILAKPYREKTRSLDRRYGEKRRHQLSYNHHIDKGFELHSMPSSSDNSRSLGKQIMKEDEQLFQLEKRHVSEMHLSNRPLGKHPYCAYSMDKPKVSEGHMDNQLAERGSPFLNIWNNASTSADSLGLIKTKYNDHDSSHGLNLPDNPFASTVWNGISTVT